MSISRETRHAERPSRRDVVGGTGALGVAAALGLVPFGTGSARADAMADWSAAPDIAKAMVQGAQFTSYGMPDSWANYGEVLQKMAAKYGFACAHSDTDMNSLEEVTKFDAEKNNAVAICADIGILFGKVAEQKGVVPPYLPPLAAKLPVGLKGDKGGWVATFTGVPAMVVNTDVIKNVPTTWADLAKPEYKGKIEAIDASNGNGTHVAVFIAWAYAAGGSETNLAPAVDFAKTMLGQFATAKGSAQTLEKGEVPIQIKYDFNCIAAARAVQAKGVNAKVIIPEGSIYAPSALMLNKFNTAKMDVAKLMLDFVLTDEGQTAFAKFGARPIRWVLGDLNLPDDAKANWLPDSDYAKVRVIPDWSKVDLQKVSGVWREDVAGRLTVTGRAALDPATGATRPAAPARAARPRRPLSARVAEWLVDWSLALPLIVLAAVMLIAPSIAMIVQSVTDDAGAFTLVNWSKTFAAASAQHAIENSLLLAVTVATIALLVGAPLSWLVSRMTRLNRSINLGILNVATNFSGIGLGFAYVAALGVYGMVTLGLKAIGIDVVPPAQSSFWGLVMAYEYSNVPLFVLLSLPAMSLLRDEWWEAAQTSAATRLQFWRHIGWPVLRPFLLADWLLIFTWSVGLYGLPVALVGERPGAFRLITVEMYRSMIGSLFGERRMPVYAVFLMILSAISLLTYRFIVRRGNKWLT